MKKNYTSVHGFKCDFCGKTFELATEAERCNQFRVFAEKVLKAGVGATWQMPVREIKNTMLCRGNPAQFMNLVHVEWPGGEDWNDIVLHFAENKHLTALMDHSNRLKPNQRLLRLKANAFCKLRPERFQLVEVDEETGEVKLRDLGWIIRKAERTLMWHRRFLKDRDKRLKEAGK